MAKYRKKPVVIEAVQYTGENTGELLGFAPDHVRVIFNNDDPCGIDVRTPNGVVGVNVGDWIMRGTTPGDYYPCPAETFAETYERVSE